MGMVLLEIFIVFEFFASYFNSAWILRYLVKMSDEYSYEASLVQQFFILGSRLLMDITPRICVNILIVLIITFALAISVKMTENYVLRKLSKGKGDLL